MTKSSLTSDQKVQAALKAVQTARAAVETANRALESAERALADELGAGITERDPSLFDGANFNEAGITRVREYWANGVSAPQAAKELKVAKSAIYYHYTKLAAEPHKPA